MTRRGKQTCDNFLAAIDRIIKEMPDALVPETPLGLPASRSNPGKSGC
jgi:hypothetical protein